MKTIKIAAMLLSILASLGSFASREGGNGGDGVILTGRTFPHISNINAFLWLDDAYNHLRYEPTTEYQLYSLDLVDMGLAKNPSLGFPSAISQSGDAVCVDEFGCYEIANTATFNKLVKRQGIFGNELDGKTLTPRMEFAITSELADLYQSYSKHKDMGWSMVIKNAAECAFECKKAPYTDEEILKNSKKRDHAANQYMVLVRKTMPQIRENLYSQETMLSIGIVNKLEEIKTVNPQFAQLLQDTLMNLDWFLLDLPIKEIDDEGYITSEIKLKTQMASRKFGVVKITKVGWSTPFEHQGEKVYPMNIPNKVALVFHEIIYQILEEQGQTDSEMARLATAFLFMPDAGNRYIEKAANIILAKDKEL